MISISDQGVGIPEAEQTYIFTPFFRGSNVLTISGLGVGLAAVKLAIDKLNGHIEFTSNLKHGTNFSITLPKERYEEE